MTDLLNELKDFGFDKKGEIVLSKKNSLPELKLFKDETSEGNVYLWIIEKDNLPFEIVYIGKAGKTLFNRCVQHMNGFRPKGNSKKGFSNGLHLLNLLNTDTKIAIYARHSQRMEILGQPDISLNDAEENALMKRYKKSHPLINI